MNIEININEYTKSVGTYLEPRLDISYMKSDNVIKVWFNNLEQITELYDRYKGDIYNDWGYVPSIEDFLETEYVLILLGCMKGEGHEVLYS